MKYFFLIYFYLVQKEGVVQNCGMHIAFLLWMKSKQGVVLKVKVS